MAPHRPCGSSLTTQLANFGQERNIDVHPSTPTPALLSTGTPGWLAKGFGLDTFGCELKLVAEDTLSPLSDPIHEELWDDKGFHLVIRSKEQIRREEYDNHPKAIWVPANESGILPAKAFFAIARLRHVQVEAYTTP